MSQSEKANHIEVMLLAVRLKIGVLDLVIDETVEESVGDVANAVHEGVSAKAVVVASQDIPTM
jgi:Flp pilus assembly protein CpaB